MFEKWNKLCFYKMRHSVETQTLWIVTRNLFTFGKPNFRGLTKKTLFARKSLISSTLSVTATLSRTGTVVILLHTWATLASGIHRAAATSSKATIENSTYVSFSISIYMLYVVILWKLSNPRIESHTQQLSRKIGSVGKRTFFSFTAWTWSSAVKVVIRKLNWGLLPPGDTLC